MPKTREEAFAFLGLPQSASESDIKKKFRSMALQFHPDRHSEKSVDEQNKAAEIFKQVTGAYDILNPNPQQGGRKKNTKKNNQIKRKIKKQTKSKVKKH